VQPIRLSQGTETAEVRAAVRHLSPMHPQGGGRRYRVGLEFVEVDGRAADWIARFIEEHRANEAAG
jgi:predicted thioesterase